MSISLIKSRFNDGCLLLKLEAKIVYAMVSKYKIIILALFWLLIGSVETYAESMDFSSSQGNDANIEPFGVHKGILANHAKLITFSENGKFIAKVKLEEPVVVSRSEVPLEWGYYQFPSMYRMEDGNILITWQMKEDSYKALGTKDVGNNKKMSKNGGRTWIDYDNRYRLEQYYYSTKKRNGDCLYILNTGSKAISSFKNFPQPSCQVEENGRHTFYIKSELPRELKGVKIQKWHYNNRVLQNKIEREYTIINDSSLYECDYDGYVTSWSGRVLELSNNEVLVCNASYHAGNNGQVNPSDISFYRMNEVDNTLIWQGSIPYAPDLRLDPSGHLRKIKGFSEPSLIELPNGDLLCVARSSYGSNISPLYRSLSQDRGVTWSKPEVVAPNGVDPSLIRLGNGTLVLITGRPGVQLRFCFDGRGIEWTEAVEMIAYHRSSEKYNVNSATCGYTDILPNDNDSFFIVYTVFDDEGTEGKYKKTIMFRKISVKFNSL